MDLFSHLPCPAIILDRHYNIVAANDRFRDLVPWLDHDAGPCSLLTICSNQTVTALDELRTRHQDTDTALTTALLLRTPDHEEIRVDVEARILPDTRFLLLLHTPRPTSHCLASCSQHQILKEQYQHNPAGILLVDADMNMISFNRQFLKMWNIPEHVQRHRDDEESLRTVVNQVRDSDTFLRKVYELYDHPDRSSTDEVELKDGRVFYRHSYPIHTAGKYLGRVWYFLDITPLKTAQRDLARQQEFQRAILEHVQDGIIACNEHGELTLFNRASRHIHGCDRDRMELEKWGRDLSWICPETEVTLPLEEIPIVKAFNGERVNNQEVMVLSPTGEKRELRANGQPMFDTDGNRMGAVISLHDITDLNRARRRLHYLAFHDPLTGLANRRLFHDLLEQNLARARRDNERVAVLFLDLDNFKEINDRLGHEAGDRILSMVAHHLKDTLRDSDLLCRWGGDEFVIALPRIESADVAIRVTDKICSGIREKLCALTAFCSVTSSIGIAMFPEHGRETDLLIRKADMAMYMAKDQGGTTSFLFDESLLGQTGGITSPRGSNTEPGESA